MKTVIPATIIAILLIITAIVASKNQPLQNTETDEIVNNVTIQNGVQIISINAKGGYEPRRSVAQANIPTIIKFKTNGTYDCSTVVRIKSLKIQKNLPPTGETEINIGSQPISIFKGSCGMGMYPFEIQFN